jgi:hypothetical protein
LVAATTLRSKPLALAGAHRNVRVGRKTRVGVCDLALAPRIGARACRSREPHSGKSRRVRQHASAISVFENWNRYYDPFWGGMLQPEPLALNPKWIARMAADGHAPPTYAYAFNNPVYFLDPDGLQGTCAGMRCATTASGELVEMGVNSINKAAAAAAVAAALAILADAAPKECKRTCIIKCFIGSNTSYTERTTAASKAECDSKAAATEERWPQFDRCVGFYSVQ